LTSTRSGQQCERFCALHYFTSDTGFNSQEKNEKAKEETNVQSLHLLLKEDRFTEQYNAFWLITLNAWFET